jgi:hypothetical protein
MLLADARPKERERRAGLARWELSAVLGLLLAMAGALTVQAWKLGITVDEPSHLLSSHLYWHGADRLQPRDMPPLIKIVCGWVPGFFPIHLDFDITKIKDVRRSEWDLALAMVERTNSSSLHPMFFFTRLPLLIFPLLTALLVWQWGRSLWGPAAGLALAFLYALEPTALGHGALVKNDIAATFTYLLFWFAAWRFWNSPSPRRAALLGGATLLALLSKMSMLWLIGIAPAIVLVRMWLSRQSARRTAAALALVLLIPYLGILSAYQFETRRTSAFELNALAKDSRLPKPLLAASHVFRVIPTAAPMWVGMLNLLQNNGNPAPVYFLGHVVPEGHPLYFITALAVKGPLPLLLLTFAGIILLAGDALRRRLDASALFWIAPGLLYIALASLSSLQLGIRLILPALPFGLLMAGRALRALLTPRRAPVLALVFLCMGVQAARVFPHGLSFFNVAAGGPGEGLRYLADSNLDWGQGLPELARYVERERISRVRLLYFGTDQARRLFRGSEIELVPLPWHERVVAERVLNLHPGYYAVSATLLPGQFFSEPWRDYLRPFRDRRPIARVANSIYIYRIEGDVAAR